MTDAYGAWVPKSMYGRPYMGVARATFVIDPRARSPTSSRRTRPKTHAAEVLAALEAISAAA